MKKQKRIVGIKFKCKNEESPLYGYNLEIVFDGSTEEYDSYSSQISYDDPDLIEEDSKDE